MMKLIFCALLLSSVTLNAQSEPQRPKTFLSKPRLVVMVVVDQLRSDRFTQKPDRFLPPGSKRQPGGYRYLMENGAWFPFADYEIAQAMTCPGHAIIASGGTPALMGITANDWIDDTTQKKIYCVADPKDGISPRRLLTSTFSDELRNQSSESKVVAISIKDRSAVMLAGQRGQQVVWYHQHSRSWITSSYYGELPSWAKSENADIAKGTRPGDLTQRTLQASIHGTEGSFRLAIRALEAEKLGRRGVTDYLAISLSNHDILGHTLGPDATEMEELAKAEDKELQNFLRAISRQLGGLNDVLIVLTSDHGIPPLPAVSEKNRLVGSGYFDHLGAIRRINEHLDRRFGKAGKEPWIQHSMYLQFYLNEDLIQRKRLKLSEVEAEAKSILVKEPDVIAVQTRSETLARSFPPGLLGEQIKNTFHPRQTGHLMTIIRPFMIERTGLAVTHMTGWSYDRLVPLFIAGPRIKPGVYEGAKIKDVAPTISYLLGTLPPAMSEGRVLTEILAK